VRDGDVEARQAAHRNWTVSFARWNDVCPADTSRDTMEKRKDLAQGMSWAINGRFLTQRMTGVQRYAHEIVMALDGILSRTDGDALSIRLVIPPAAATPSLSKIAVCRTSFASGHLWDQLVLPFYAGGGVLSLGNFGPIASSHHIVCIHDANTFILPESYSRAFALVYRNLLPVLGRRATRVATVSQFSADMMVKFGVCRREKIFIAPNGHEHVLRWDARRAKIPLIRTLKRPYIFLLGSTARHKNVDVILGQAAALDESGIDIVVAGGGSGIFAASAKEVRRPNVHQLGFVSDDDLAALYENALCLVFPSKTEGFGIPPLEAMAKGCPVICSNAASLVEVGGDAFIYVDPDDRNGWRRTIVALSGNEELRASLSRKGRERAKLYSWTRSAQLYLQEMMNLPNR
jgi:glycosyltransferase involved in cell wall biosynthesis